MNGGLLGFPGISAPGSFTEYDVWRYRINVVGGILTGSSEQYAFRFVESLRTRSFYGKLLYLLPFLGANIEAATVPLVDVLNRGPASNVGFVSADFTESTGLSNPTEAAKYFDTLIKPSELGASNNGGLGWVERAIGLGTGVEPIGCYNNSSTQRFVIDLRSNVQNFRWGTASNGSGNTSTAINAHYYGQRAASNSRSLYRDAVQVGTTNTTNDTASAAADRTIYVMGVNTSPLTYWKGRSGCAYMTSGNLTAAEITDLHALINDFLIIPTGR
jgi:hypothetical protein